LALLGVVRPGASLSGVAHCKQEHPKIGHKKKNIPELENPTRFQARLRGPFMIQRKLIEI